MGTFYITRYHYILNKNINKKTINEINIKKKNLDDHLIIIKGQQHYHYPKHFALFGLPPTSYPPKGLLVISDQFSHHHV